MQSHKITALGHLGDGVTDTGLFAALTVPGDEVEGSIEADRLVDLRITSPSDLRVKPPCTHFKSCGGCGLQHVRDDFVAGWKADLVRSALAAHGLETEIRPTLTSPARSRRRATLSARRTKSGALVGFHARASDVVISVSGCTLLVPEILATTPLCEALAKEGASRKHALNVTVTLTNTGLDVAVTGGKPLDTPLQSRLAALCEAHSLTRIVWNDEVAALRAPSTVSFDGIDVPLPPGAFLQATSHGEASLRSCVAEIVGGAAHVTDLFAGCGTFALPLARKAEILAVEGEKGMIRALNDGWRHASGLKNVKTETRDLFRNPLLAEEFRKTAAIVIDPPRAGAAAQIAEIAKSDVPAIAHVSCNARTFARDARTLCDAGYTLTWAQPVDQFRWSPHVEIVAAFER